MGDFCIPPLLCYFQAHPVYISEVQVQGKGQVNVFIKVMAFPCFPFDTVKVFLLLTTSYL